MDVIKYSFFLLLLSCCWLVKGTVVKVDVLILGGGLSGITAANHLYNNDLRNFLVLEAQDYFGGRLKNASFGGFTLGEGANWVHYIEDGEDNPILQLTKKLNISASLENEYDYVVKNLPNASSSLVNATFKELDEATKKIVKDNEEISYELCQDKSLSKALEENGWKPDTGFKKTVEWLVYDYEYAVKTTNISTRHFSGFPTENAFVTAPKGYATVIKYLAKNFTDKIKTNTIVTEIKYSSDGVEVKTKNGDTYKANYTLCTFSPGVLASDSVKYVPEFPSWKKEAIKKIPLAFYTHVLAKFPVAFWEDVEYLYDGGEKRGKFPLAYNMNHKKFHPGSNVLLFTAIGDDSIRVESQSENDTINEVMESLQIMYPKKNISRPTEFLVSKWSKNPYVRGSFSNAGIGSTLADFHNLEGRLGNLFFSGEACDEDYWGYLQGAYFTGLRQAKAIVSCFNGNKCEAYQPESTKQPCPSTSPSTSPSAGYSSLRSQETVMVLILISFITILKIV